MRHLLQDVTTERSEYKVVELMSYFYGFLPRGLYRNSMVYGVMFLDTPLYKFCRSGGVVVRLWYTDNE